METKENNVTLSRNPIKYSDFGFGKFLNVVLSYLQILYGENMCIKNTHLRVIYTGNQRQLKKKKKKTG